MIASFCRIAGEGKHMPHAERRHAEEFALQADQVFIPATEMEQRSDAPLLEQGGHGKITHPQNGEGIVSEGDGVGSGCRKCFCSDKKLLQGKGLGRIELRHDDGFPLGDQVEQACLLRRNVSSTTVIPGVLFLAGLSPWSTAASAAMCRGEVPQHPPTKAAPAPAVRRPKSAK